MVKIQSFITIMLGVFYWFFCNEKPNCNSYLIINKSIDSISNKKSNCSVYLEGLKGYSLEIKTTYLSDNNSLNYEYWLTPNRIVIRQALIFKYKNKILARRNFAVNNNNVNKNGVKNHILDNVIQLVGLVRGKNGAFYRIYGSGGCNSCSEYWGDFSMSGRILTELYASRQNKFVKRLGNSNEVAKNYAVDTSRIQSHGLKAIYVFPPQQAGRETEAQIW